MSSGSAPAGTINSMVMMTLGTGIGGGIILDGKLWKGANEGAGEIGHQIINPNGRLCGCGHFGDLEAEASQRRHHRARPSEDPDGPEDVAGPQGGGQPRPLTPAIIAEAAFEGDDVSLEVMQETGYFVGIGVANAINFLNPEMVVIGGGISRAGFVLWDPIMRTVKSERARGGAGGLPGRAVRSCATTPASLAE